MYKELNTKLSDLIPKDKRLTKAMINRADCLCEDWKDEGQNYFSLVGSTPHGRVVAYIALPKKHPDCNKHYHSFVPDVNGGLTYSDDNVYGWDYSHYTNDFDTAKHIKNALKYFRDRESGGLNEKKK
jgi:hypothetical protein